MTAGKEKKKGKNQGEPFFFSGKNWVIGPLFRFLAKRTAGWGE